MPLITIALFGRFQVCCQDQRVADLDKSKVQELLSYLLLHREQPHTREALATLLWEDIPLAQSKRYLRKTLWQLQSPFELRLPQRAQRLLLVQPNWVQVNPDADFVLDVAIIENAFAACRGIPSHLLQPEIIVLLQQAAAIYTGNLLEGWFHDWCLYERERLQRMYLIILDKLIENYIVHNQFDSGIAYSLQALRFDVARERIHRHLMRLYYLAGDRTQALRQFEYCSTILKREFNITPGHRTVSLYQQILEDVPINSAREGEHLAWNIHEAELRPANHQLTKLHTDLEFMQQRIRQMSRLVQDLFEQEDRSEIRFR